MKNVSETVEKVYGNYTERVLQFGEGNFLRAFVDWMIEGANERGDYRGSVVLCQAIEGGEHIRSLINEQNGIYTVAMRGMENGNAVEKFKTVTCISRCINAYSDYDALVNLIKSPDLEVVVSNTTEAGIRYEPSDKLSDKPASSFPAKVTQLLYERFLEFSGDMTKGLLFLPVELIDNNGHELKRIVLKYAKQWELPEEFLAWVNEANKFASTLVDRIVTGYPKGNEQYFIDKLGYKDNLTVTCEIFNLWVIEGDRSRADILPIHKGEANVLWTGDVSPYKKRKVRILNGGHTGTVPFAYLAGFDFVGEFMNNSEFLNYLKSMLFEEIIPTLDLPHDELCDFATSVEQRFLNPFIKHRLLDICLNSCSKFNARCLPSLLEYYEKNKKLPTHLTFALAAFIRFYRGEFADDKFMGKRPNGDEYEIRDDKSVLEFFSQAWSDSTDYKRVAEAVLSKTEFWDGKNLTEIPMLLEKTASYLELMDKKDMMEIAKMLG